MPTRYARCEFAVDCPAIRTLNRVPWHNYNAVLNVSAISVFYILHHPHCWLRTTHKHIKQSSTQNCLNVRAKKNSFIENRIAKSDQDVLKMRIVKHHHGIIILKPWALAWTFVKCLADIQYVCWNRSWCLKKIFNCRSSIHLEYQISHTYRLSPSR